MLRTFFTRERFGTPQVLAGCLLLAFLAQCAWLISREQPAAVSAEEFVRVQEGVGQWHGHGIAGTPTSLIGSLEPIRMRGPEYDPDHSPLWYLIESAPLAPFGVPTGSPAWFWLTRLPYVIIGCLLGASLWYVSRRLYGNAGGYTALALYCFSPTVIRNSVLWFSGPDIASAWGTFGAVFTAIAVSHTLYAPREVVLWNWRRILLLGVSLIVAGGTHYGVVIVLPVLLAFMLYVAPTRRMAAITILLAACGIAVFLLLAAYFFHPTLFAHGVGSAVPFRGSLAALKMPAAYLNVLTEIMASGPVLVVLAPLALASWIAWRRSRYFGNTAPLLVAILFLGLRVAAPHQSQAVYGLVGVVFLCVFVAGIAADLLETKAQELGAAMLTGALVANALWNLLQLARIGG